ncbi:formate dehydrogenase accessory protein FdhE [Rhizobiaceae bacterium n13]|uniref:Protein FdhE homolog n=2 Tax=Ferirhizobium litorale TaxID=2927786 RepID=A0AAE3U1P6_9HYPH|nr:formate dehydrogenase accessory protein FdhE [Fererhizobium litorale]MDI7920488.1 formate dehydrogenase accessory protein FdhE [Fererhizobium litorale]
MIGRISKAPFALTPDPGKLFKERVARLEILAKDAHLGPYLTFLAGIARIQGELASSLSALEPVPVDQVERARENAMPPIDRAAIVQSQDCRRTLLRFLEAVGALEMPPTASQALAQLREADEETMDWMIDNVLADDLPVESLAHHLFVAAAIQVHAARLAATLDANGLVPVRVGVCPACGGKPVASIVVGVQGVEGARYGCCSCCSTMWNEVRIKCLACGSTKGVGYRAVETGTDEATVKAEVCDSCHSWVKILYQNKNPSLEAVADDVASLGLDLLMKDTEYKRAGFNPFLVGY